MNGYITEKELQDQLSALKAKLESEAATREKKILLELDELKNATLKQNIASEYFYGKVMPLFIVPGMVLVSILLLFKH